MDKRKLGNSDLEITPLGIGAWAIGGGGWAFAWGPQDDAESIASLRAGIDAGLNWIDTAAVYGLGHSEEMVAKALEGVSQSVYVFTKCERRWNEKGEIQKVLKRDSIKEECENSLRRLKRDVIDLYQIHWPEPDEDIEEGWGAMAELQREGKVRWIGVSNFNVAQMQRAQAIAPITSLQPPYSMLVRGVEPEILPYCQQNGIVGGDCGTTWSNSRRGCHCLGAAEPCGYRRDCGRSAARSGGRRDWRRRVAAVGCRSDSY
jgi:aryl-alcohol dehydrogenase-like predicted oxidoreductase